ncbi:DUF6093 family protein [Streptomyces sp. NPDC088925]|uniref:DUF6093 family protein n=1 Tax=Streptomyces sp. NPDC088925 TaxID=3365914 RepID=UPI003818C1F8
MTTPVGGLPLDAARRAVEARVLRDRVKVFQPGVFDPDTWETTPDVVLWEGPGAILPDRSPDVTVTVQDGQGTPVGKTGTYRLLMPLSAPVPTREYKVTLTASEDADALGRLWTVDEVERSSISVLRTTWLRYDTTLNGGN